MNLNGQLDSRVTATGEATALAHIIAAVERAQNSRAEIQRLGDRVSSVFVPVVVAIALATGLWWGLAPEQAAQRASMAGAIFVAGDVAGGRAGGGVHPGGGGVDHRLPLRDGPGHARGHHGGRRTRRRGAEF